MEHFLDCHGDVNADIQSSVISNGLPSLGDKDAFAAIAGNTQTMECDRSDSKRKAYAKQSH